MAWYNTLGTLGLKALGAATKGVRGTVELATKGVKGTMEIAPKVVKGAIHVAERNPKTAIAAGVIAYHRQTGKGAMDLATEVIGGEEAKGKGAGHAINGFIFGKENQDKAMVGNLVDTLAGEGTSDSIANKAGDMATKVGEAYGQAKDTVVGVFQGNGMVNNENGMMMDPTQTYPDMSQMSGVSGQGVAGNFMSAMNNATSSITGGNISKMNMASLLLSAYMMFGRFGWLGKAASMLLGGMTLRNINQRNAFAQQQPVQQLPLQQPVQQLPLQQPEQVQPVLQDAQKTMQMQLDNDDQVVVRSRGL